MEGLLYASFGLLVYTYAGYPLLSALLAILARRPHRREPVEPQISLVILAHNEERDIAAKLDNSLALDYPKDKLEIVVASDGSTDRTDEIVREYQARGVKLFRAEDHPGKTGATNRSVRETAGEILVFSDATGKYSRGALRALAQNFADPGVGAASGRVVYDYGSSASSAGFRAYQRLVVFSRRADGEWGTETSVSGSISAVRRELFLELPQHLDFDMAHPFHVAHAGLRTVYEADAISQEESRTEPGTEFGARVRMAIFAYSFLPYLFRGLGTCRNRIYIFQMLSNKLLRWFSPFLLIALLGSSASLANRSDLAFWLLIAQLSLYAAAAIGWTGRGSDRLRQLVGAPLFFATINLAFLAGFGRWLRGERIGSWQTAR